MNKFKKYTGGFDVLGRGDVYEEYNLNDPVSSEQFDKDCKDAYDFFAEEGVKYEISSHHWCEVTDEDRVVDMVSVSWEFWRETE